MPVMTVSEARKDLFGLIDDVAEEHRGYCIVGKRNQAVLLSMEDWVARGSGTGEYVEVNMSLRMAAGRK